MTNIESPYGTHASYIDWGVIFAGSVLACAITTVLLQFGAVIGLAQINIGASADANITPGLVLGTGIWLLWVQLLSSLAGGYLAGRMRAPIAGATEHERDMRDGAHGLLVWATSTLGVLVAVSAVSAIAAIAEPAPAEAIAEAADVTRIRDNATVIFAFGAATTALVSGVVSWWAATMGGDHRDTRADHTRYFSFRVLR